MTKTVHTSQKEGVGNGVVGVIRGGGQGQKPKELCNELKVEIEVMERVNE